MELLIKLQNKTDIQILLPLFDRLGVSVLPQTALTELVTANEAQDWSAFLQLLFQETKISPKPNLKSVTDSLPISYAKKPNFKALEGIWKHKSIDPIALRKAAWGNRL